ncbi:MAG: hypothetical protein AAGA56_06305 [Myxococcota bacterium]
MTTPGLGRITPIQDYLLQLAGYRLRRTREQASLSDTERLNVMREGLAALRRATKVDLGYDLGAWEAYLLQHQESFRHGYAKGTTQRHVAAARADPQRRRLVAAPADEDGPSGLSLASRAVSSSAGEDRVARYGDDTRDVLVVADGAGGSGAGAEAADAVLHAIRRAPWALDVCDVLREADHIVAQASHGGETTVVVARVIDGEVVGASVGDSGAWLFTPAEAVELTGRQVRKPLLGSGRARPVPFRAMLVGRLLLATDGLLKYIPLAKLTELSVRQPVASSCDALIQAARLPSGGLQDDIAVLLAETGAKRQ